MGSITKAKLLVLPAAAIALILAGCSSTPDASGAGDPTSSERYAVSATLVRAEKAGVLRIAVDTEPPISSIVDNNAVGVVPAVLEEFVKRVGMNVRIQAIATPFSSMVPEVQSGRVDTIAAGMYNTPARAKVVNFTDPVLYNPETLMVPKGNPKHISGINTSSLHGLTVGSYAGTTMLTDLQALAKKDSSIQVKSFTTANLLALAVSQEQIDAGYIDQVSGAYFLKQDPSLKYEVLTGLADAQPKSETGDCLPVIKTDPQFVSLFNTVWNEMKADGSASKIMEQNGLVPAASFLNAN